ncbi:transposase [Enterococcus faecalis]|uniref:Transposase n=3 Tax=Enterococcus TaxID=1350 RepID=A0ABD7IVI3_ENTFL|nr:transposase [Enterococcus faecalis]EGO8469517.1 transposase [Enterococcus faecalis]EGO8482481.1 transposase [Enterococcus faecalis]EGO8541402.1 transposase [Enterococcus faecalis]EGO8642949.1 transposase [Enterococcus faecalis]
MRCTNHPRTMKKFRLTVLLEATKFPKATYMYWQKRFERKNPNQKLEAQIKKIFDENKGNYGYRRIQLALKEQGLNVNQKKIRRLMRKLVLKGTKFIRKSRKYNSYKGTVGYGEKNRLHRCFYTSVPYQKLITDTSKFKYYECNKSGNIQIKNSIWILFLIYLKSKSCLTVFLNSQMPKQFFRHKKKSLIKRKLGHIVALFIPTKVGGYQMKQYKNN